MVGYEILHNSFGWMVAGGAMIGLKALVFMGLVKDNVEDDYESHLNSKHVNNWINKKMNGKEVPLYIRRYVRQPGGGFKTEYEFILETSEYYHATYTYLAKLNCPPGTTHEWVSEKGCWGYSEKHPAPEVTVFMSPGMAEAANEILNGTPKETEIEAK